MNSLNKLRRVCFYHSMDTDILIFSITTQKETNNALAPLVSLNLHIMTDRTNPDTSMILTGDNVDRVTHYQFRCFHHDFAQSWVSVNSKCQIFQSCAHLDCKTKLSNQVEASRPTIWQPSTRPLSSSATIFTKPSSMVQRYCTAVTRIREFTRFYFVTFSFASFSV